MFSLLLAVALCTLPIDVNVTVVALETGKRIATNLTWGVVTDGQGSHAHHYVVYKRKASADWQSISLFDFNDKRAVRVLNAYPSKYKDKVGGPSLANFTYADGTKVEREKSSALKVWMEGGYIDGEHFENFGVNQVTAGQSIMVDVITMDGLNKNVTKIWDYDIVVFGTWDSSGRVAYDESKNDYNYLWNAPSAECADELKKFINAKHGVIASHDTIAYATGTTVGLSRIRDMFGIKVGQSSPGFWETNGTDIGSDKYWWIESTQVKVVKYGDVIDFPWNLTGRLLTIPLTHTISNMATADVWMELTNISAQARYTPLLDPANQTGHTYYYLTTKNNTAMIQTGHSNCKATSDERRIWANLIYFLQQRTEKTMRVDHSSVDEDAPTKPQCACYIHENKEAHIDCTSKEPETIYEYQVEAYKDRVSENLMGRSDVLKVDVASGFDAFYFLPDKTENAKAEDIRKLGTRVPHGKARLPYSSDIKRWRVIAADRAENESPVLDVIASQCRRATSPFTEDSDAYDKWSVSGITSNILNLFFTFTAIALDTE